MHVLSNGTGRVLDVSLVKKMNGIAVFGCDLLCSNVQCTVLSWCMDFVMNSKINLFGCFGASLELFVERAN